MLLVKSINKDDTKVTEGANTITNVQQKEEQNEVVNNVKDTVENNNSNSNVQENGELKTEIKEVEKYVFPKYDSSKMQNDNLQNYSVWVRLGYPASTATISSEGKVNVFINTDTRNEFLDVINLSGKVVDVIGGPHMNGSKSIMILLMEDGSVEYTEDLYQAQGQIKSVGKIKGISNIVRICYLNNNKGGIPIAIDKNGNSYSLAELID